MTDSVAGNICIVICNEGYQLRGSENRTCGNDGTWDGTDTTCTVPPGMTVYLTICKLLFIDNLIVFLLTLFVWRMMLFLALNRTTNVYCSKQILLYSKTLSRQ